MRRDIEMKKKFLAIGVIASWLVCFAADAAIYGTSASTVSTVDSYTQFGGGDVIFTLSSNSLQSSCPSGFWIHGTDVGAKTAVGELLAAFHAAKPVLVWADTAIIWTGSASPACQVWEIRTTN
jgi:hypothetical protein